MFQGDMTKLEDCQNMGGAAMDRYGRVDILDNNVGISQRGTVVEVSEDDWDRVMTVHLKTMVLASKAAIPRMIESGGGSIVNISSTAGLVASPYSGASYAATKGAVRLFTKATAIQYAKEGIRCNSVHPGLLETPMTQDMLADAAHREERTQRIPLGRVGTAADIAYGVLYLASDEASFVTGSELVIDGGATAQ